MARISTDPEFELPTDDVPEVQVGEMDVDHETPDASVGDVTSESASVVTPSDIEAEWQSAQPVDATSGDEINDEDELDEDEVVAFDDDEGEGEDADEVIAPVVHDSDVIEERRTKVDALFGRLMFRRTFRPGERWKARQGRYAR